MEQQSKYRVFSLAKRKNIEEAAQNMKKEGIKLCITYQDCEQDIQFVEPESTNTEGLERD